jgi:hypothetical protein
MKPKPRSVPFPPSPEVGDPYSIWKFDGVYWMLDPDQMEGSVTTWDELKEKPQSIEALGYDNEVSSGAYQPARQGAEDAAEFWKAGEKE